MFFAVINKLVFFKNKLITHFYAICSFSYFAMSALYGFGIARVLWIIYVIALRSFFNFSSKSAKLHSGNWFSLIFVVLNTLFKLPKRSNCVTQHSYHSVKNVVYFGEFLLFSITEKHVFNKSLHFSTREIGHPVCSVRKGRLW